MKRCPKCSADYFDNMLEFCLEDGARLAFSAQFPAAPRASEAPIRPGPISQRNSEETVVVPAEKKFERGIIPAPLNESAAERIIERAAIVLALAHNWWQWLYLEKTYVYSLTDYVLSANFLMWLVLLAGGAIAGIYSLRQSKDKTIPIVSLVILAINLILYLVPRR